MRCFIAVEIPQSVRKKLWRILEPKTKAFPNLKWVKPKNWHITLKFLGEIGERDVENVKETLQVISKEFEPFEVSFGDFGTFPPRGSLRVFWIGLKDGATTIARLAEMVENRLARIGFPREERKFTPHLTLARARKGRSSNVTLEDLELDTVDIPKFTFKEMILFESNLRPEGPIYTKLKEFVFSKGK